MSPEEKLDPIPDSFILQPPVFHPVVPYVTTIFGGLHAGKMVMLQGMVPLAARRFQVDFQCGCSLRPRPDIAIHFNPRFHTTEPHVICNTLHDEHWQKEARWPGLALQRGASFLILFLFGGEEVKVSVNGQHFLHYRYRLPLARVDTLGIFGDIVVKAIGFLNINPFVEGHREYPVGHPFLLKSPQLKAASRGWAGQLQSEAPASFDFFFMYSANRGALFMCSSPGSLARASHHSTGADLARAKGVLLLCQEGGLKLALNGQGLGATSLGQETLERLRELQIGGSIQLYCVHC